MHYTSTGKKERERAMCATTHTLFLSLFLSLSLPIYRGARPRTDYIDRERNIDPSQRRRALTAHHLHTYIINAPTTAIAAHTHGGVYFCCLQNLFATECKHREYRAYDGLSKIHLQYAVSFQLINFMQCILSLEILRKREKDKSLGVKLYIGNFFYRGRND